MRYVLPFSDLATGASADTFKTLVALVLANTAGHRFRVRALSVGPSDDAPDDKNVAVRLARTDNTGAATGGSAVTAANIPKKDSLSRDTVATAVRGPTAEPTTYETEPVYQMDFNIRGGLLKEWSDIDAPIVNRNQTLGLLAAPRAAAAVRLSGSIEIEEF
jgi:hypothetical protein